MLDLRPMPGVGRAAPRPCRCRWTTSMRKPSTPRSSQKRSTSCIASTTSGLRQFRSGCSGRNGWQVVLAASRRPTSRPAAAEDRAASCSAARRPAPRSRQTYQSRFGVVAARPRVARTTGAGPRCGSAPSRGDLDAARVRLRDQRVEVGEVAEERVDVAVVGDVVAEVGHRRRVERREPDGVDAEPAAR